MIRDPDFKLTPNFKFKEVFKSDTAIRLGIDNASAITEDILASAVELSEKILEPVRARYGSYSPNSWFRGEELEYAICARAFFSRLQKQGVEGVTADSPKIYASLFSLPTKYTAYWDAYFGRKQHPKGMACDFEITGLSNQVLFDWCRDNLQYDQLILEFHRPEQGSNSGWVHGSNNNKGANRNQLLRY
jgi:hypothetical protein